MDLKAKRVLVTGGAGFIGSHLVDRLLDHAGVASLRVLDNLSNGRRENLPALDRDPRLELVQGDVADADACTHACRNADVVFHLACLGVRHSIHAPLDNHRVNAEGALRMLLAAREAGVQRYVHVSSSEVFGTARYAPMDETHPTLPETVYGGGKLAGEAYARAFHQTYGFPSMVVRPFNTYGPRSHFEGDCGEVIPRFMVKALCGESPVIFGDGGQTRDFLHVNDTARALVELAACDAAVGRTVNVGYGSEVTVNDLCRTILAAVQRKDLVPRHLEPRPGDVRRLWVDNRRVHELIGFEPRVDLDQGLAELVGWFRNLAADPRDLAALMPERNWFSE